MKFIFQLLTIIGSISFAHAQTEVDALRYSTPFSTGSARSAAIGNATSAIGGEISTLNYNPAGLAQISISEFTISAGFNATNSKNNYLNTSTKAQKTAFQINNAGLAYVPKKNFSNIKNITIAGSYQRLNSFNYQIKANGINNKSSYSDIYAQELNNNGADSTSAMNDYLFGSSLAFESGIIGMTDDHSFFSYLYLPITQQYNITRKGSHNEFSLGTGIAFNDQWMVGLSIGIPTINYEESFHVMESDHKNVTQDFNYWDKEDRYRTEGNGINAKIGVLFQPTPSIRIGASFTTPTRYTMKDIYRTAFRADYEDYTVDNFQNPTEGYFDYKMRTPLKFNVGGAYVDPRWGLISVEYEYSDPSKSKYIFGNEFYDLSSAETALNDQISNNYKANHTIKAGIEGIVAEHFRVRGGYQYKTSPFANQESLDQFVKNTVMAISGGLGYRGKTFYTDLTYVHVLSDELLVPYSVSVPVQDAPILTSKYGRGNVVLSVGFKF